MCKNRAWTLVTSYIHHSHGLRSLSGRRRQRKVIGGSLSPSISGRGWRMCPPRFAPPLSPLATLVLVVCTVFRITEACSSRSTPKPRPPSPTMRPNITFQTYACPPAYAAWYCLNGATCFTVKIGESILYNCECADGYMGQRCQFKDLDGSYLPSREKVMLETASIAGGATIAILLVVILSIASYICVRKRKKEQRLSTKEVSAEELERRPFSSRPTLRSHAVPMGAVQHERHPHSTDAGSGPGSSVHSSTGPPDLHGDPAP